MDFLGPRRPSVDTTELKDTVRRLFDLSEDTTVMLSELRCSEPGCPPVETVIAILSAEEKRQFKVHKPLREVTTADIESLAGKTAG